LYLFREELGKGINTDEAAALGAVYQAANLGKGFKVKKFGIKDATVYPIKVRVLTLKLLFCIFVFSVTFHVRHYFYSCRFYNFILCVTYAKYYISALTLLGMHMACKILATANPTGSLQ